MSTPRTTTAAAAKTPVAETYPLKREPDGRSWTVREDIVDILERELLGPLNGPDEILDASPDTVYLIGRVAPVRLTDEKDVPREAGTDDAPTDVGDDLDAEIARGVPVTAVDDSTASADEDTVEDDPQKRGLIIPSSMGLRFQIPADQAVFTVTASWGEYHRVTAEGDTSRSRRYLRTPIEIPTKIVVADLAVGQNTTFPLKDDVVLRIERHDNPDRGCRLVEVVLCNDRETPRRIPVEAWLYQTRLTVEADGAAAFLPAFDALADTRKERDDELRRLQLQYRDRLEFAIGRTCSVDWQVDGDTREATKVWTTWLPTCETPQTAAEEIKSALLDMFELAAATPAQLEAGLTPIVESYRGWLDQQDAHADALPNHLRAEGKDAVKEARKVQQQLEVGLQYLLSDLEALRCFHFMNKVMAEQRLHTQIAERRAKNPKESIDAARAAILADKGAAAHTWYTFQLAFILMQLPLLSDPAAPYRSGDLAKAQLLFFPTGGGKTEAYLGLAAYTFAIRRRQSIFETPDGPLDGRSGVAVLMRYTLRLLTAQQFQRATALVCATELARADDPATWGDEPFRIGLWVGTDVSPKRFEEAESQLA